MNISETHDLVFNSIVKLAKPTHECLSSCRREGCPMLDSCYDVNGDCEEDHCRCDNEPTKTQQQQKDTEDNNKSLTK